MPTYAQNKKAHFDYEILDEYEAGLVLSGQETKSARNGGARLKGAFITFKTDGSAWVTNMHISPYKFAGTIKDYDPTASRKILLTKKELNSLREKSQELGLTIVPLSLYTKGRFIKLKIGLGRGKKKYDKRETIRKRDLQREARKNLKGGGRIR